MTIPQIYKKNKVKEEDVALNTFTSWINRGFVNVKPYITIVDGHGFPIHEAFPLIKEEVEDYINSGGKVESIKQVWEDLNLLERYGVNYDLFNSWVRKEHISLFRGSEQFEDGETLNNGEKLIKGEK